MTAVDRRTVLKAGLAGGLAIGLGAAGGGSAEAAARVDRTLAHGPGRPVGAGVPADRQRAGR